MVSTPNGQSIADRFRAALDEVQSNSELAVLDRTEELLPEDSRSFKAMSEDLATYAHVNLDPSWSRCFLPYTRLALAWSSKDKKAGVGGEFALRYLYSAISKPPKLWESNMPAKEQELLKTFRVFDDHPRGGRGTLAALQIEPGVTSPRVWFYNVKREPLPLDVDYCGYLEALLTTKGYYGWQYLFADIDLTADENRGLRRDLEKMLDVLPRLFPDHDYEPLRKRLADRTSGKTSGGKK